MSFLALSTISVLIFLFVAAKNREGEITIAFSKSLLFGFLYDDDIDDGIKYHTFQAALGFIILNVYYETIVE